MNSQDFKINRGIVSARSSTYLTLTGIDNQDGEYRVIREINEIIVPPIREVVRISEVVYLAVTVSGDLFSFTTGELINLGSPVVTALNTGVNALLVLLKNGRLRMIYIDSDNKLVSSNERDMDREIPQFAIMVNPLYDELMTSGDRYNIPYWLVITSDNELIVTALGYHNPGRRGDEPHVWYLEREGIIKNDSVIDHRDILMIKGGSILMHDDRIYSIKGENGKYQLVEVKHSITGIIDILPLKDRMAALTEKNELWSILNDGSEKRIQLLKEIEPVELLYVNDSDDAVLLEILDDIVHIRGVDGIIYQVSDDGEVV